MKRNTFLSAILILGMLTIIASCGGGSSDTNIREKTEDGKGLIRGTVWNDSNGDSIQTVGESGLEGWTVFLDTNKDGFPDSNETYTTTNNDGKYELSGLEFDTYTVAIDLQTGWNQTRSFHTEQSCTIPRIIGGEVADPDTWPWMAALLDSNEEDNYDVWFCGGFLIRSGWILTAAHCLFDKYGIPFPASSIDVFLGSNDLLSSDARRIRTAQIIVHPDYYIVSNEEPINDVALLRLSEPSSQPTAELITIDNGILAAPGVMAIAIGWGVQEDDTHMMPTLLQQVDLPIVSNTVAQDSYGSHLNITHEMLCAGYAEGGKDTCQGDSGGPLLVPNAQDNGWIVAGVTSFGEGCAEPGHYGIYARVSEFSGWIDDTISIYYKVITVSGGVIYSGIDFGIQKDISQ